MRRAGLGRGGRRVLVCSSGGVRNLGDDAILLRTAQRIRAAMPRTRIDVLTDEAGPIPRLRGMRAVGVHAPGLDVDMAHYAFLVVAGGGYACDWFATHLIPRVEIATRAARAGVPVLVTGQGVGPLTDDAGIAELRKLADRAVAFSVRDELSRSFLDHHGIESTLTGDDALGLAGLAETPRARGHLVVHVRDAFYNSTDSASLAQWTRVAREMAAARDLGIVGLAINSRAEAPERDTLRALGIDDLIDARTDPLVLADCTAAAAAVVTHSYHVALFALAAGTPVVLAAANPYYAQKAEGLRRLADVSDAFVAADPPCSKELGERLDAVRADLAGNDALAGATARVDAFFAAHSRPAVR